MNGEVKMKSHKKVTRSDVINWAKEAKIDLPDQWKNIQQNLPHHHKPVINSTNNRKIASKNRFLIAYAGLAVLILVVGLFISGQFSNGIFSNNSGNSTELKKSYINSSWAYNYGDIEGLTNASDVIALVKVVSISKEYVDQEIPFTEFKVLVITPVHNSKKDDFLIIRMTGGPYKEVLYEMDDAPLLNIGEELLIFCKENTIGTLPSYTILSGAQGRLYYSNGKLNSLGMIDEKFEDSIQIKDADLDETINQNHSYLDKK